jgi:light-independent protochlorophyllide reductase subunit B
MISWPKWPGCGDRAEKGPVPPAPALVVASVDSTYLTGKRVFLFGDATHVTTAARIARDEMGFEVVGLGCYNREFARDIRALGKEFGVEPLITDDYLEVEKAIEAPRPR